MAQDTELCPPTPPHPQPSSFVQAPAAEALDTASLEGLNKRLNTLEAAAKEKLVEQVRQSVISAIYPRLVEFLHSHAALSAHSMPLHTCAAVVLLFAFKCCARHFDIFSSSAAVHVAQGC